MFPFDSVFYHLVLFAFNCLIFKELCRPLSHRLCLATAFIYYHVLNPLSTLFLNYFQFCFSVVTVLLTTLLSYHLLTLFVNIFFSLSSTFFCLSFFSFFIFLLVATLWFYSGYFLALFWLWPGCLLVRHFSFFSLWVASLFLFYWFSFHFIRNRFEPFYLYRQSIPYFEIVD